MAALAAFPTLDPAFTLSALGFVLAGVFCGTLSGLTPGLHANNFALLTETLQYLNNCLHL